MTLPSKVKIERVRRAPNRWWWFVEWGAPNDCTYGVGGWTLTKAGARLEARRAITEAAS